MPTSTAETQLESFTNQDHQEQVLVKGPTDMITNPAQPAPADGWPTQNQR